MESPSPEPAASANRPWRNFSSVYRRLAPPLRPSDSDVERVRHGLAGYTGRVLLLGLTPELSILSDDLTAVDNSAAMLAKVWPGDTRCRRALLADWTRLPFPNASFTAVIGDGALNSVPEHVDEVLNESKRVLCPAGRAVFRIFCAPASPDTFQRIKRDLVDGQIENVHALKWRIAMALAATQSSAIVSVQEILSAFNNLFPDRAKLARRMGWSLADIATIDAYVGADHTLLFPTLENVLEKISLRFNTVSVAPATEYPLAERCPTIVANLS